MNIVVLVGRLTKDPEMKGDASKVVTTFTIAVSRDFKDASGNYGADFVNCVAFGKTGEFVEKYFKKGGLIGVSGRINTGSYKNKDGQTIYTTNVAVEKAKFIGSKSDSSGETTAAAPEEKPKRTAKAKQKDDDGFLNIPDSVDDVPWINA